MGPTCEPRFSRTEAAVLALVLALTLAVYSGVMQSGFVPFDDDIEITTNAHICGLGAANWAWMWTDTQTTMRYTPLSWVAWALLYRGWGLNPAAFHVEAVIVHLVNTALVFVLIREVLWRSVRAAKENALALGAGLGAALWAVHPLRVEVVAWVTQVRFAEATVFLLLALLCYLRGAGSLGWPWRSGWYWGAWAAAVVSVLFYPVGIGLPALLVGLDVFPLKRLVPRVSGWRDWLGVVVEKLPFLAAPVFVGLMTMHGRSAAAGIWTKPVSLAEFGVGARAMQALYIFAHYLWKPFDVLHLSPVYTTLVKFDPASVAFIASAGAVVVLTGVAIWAWRRSPAVTVVWFAHLVLMAPMGGYFEHPHYPSDRYAYGQGILGGMVMGGLAVWAIKRWRGVALKAGVGAAVAGVLALAMLANMQTQAWRNGETLFRHMLAELGSDPYRADIHWRLGAYYLEQRRYPEAIEQCDATLAIEPREVRALQIRADAARAAGQEAEKRGASRERVAEMHGEWASSLRRLYVLTRQVEVLEQLGIACAQAGRLEEAQRAFEECIRTAPQRGGYRLGLAQVRYLQGAGTEAKAMVRAAVAVDPTIGAMAEGMLERWSEAEGRGGPWPARP